MWLRQISSYPLNKDRLPELEVFADKLAQSEFTHCQGLDWFNEGSATPVSFSLELTFPANYIWRVALKKEKKVPPVGAIHDILDEKVLETQNSEARNIGCREKQEPKGQTTNDLLPRAFMRSSRIQAIFDTRYGYFLANNVASAKAENILTKPREALGSLKAVLSNARQLSSSPMTSRLLRGHCGGGSRSGSDCKLRGVGNVIPVVKVSKQDLTTDEVVRRVRNDKAVTQPGLVWREQIAFILTQGFTLERIQYLDVLQEEAESSGDDAANLTFASQILMIEAINIMLEKLVSYLGGWQE